MTQFECPFSLYARKAPKQQAIVNGDKTLDYGTCHRLIHRAYKHLIDQGVKQGDCVAILVPNNDPSPYLPLVLFSLFRIGAIAAPLHTRHPEETLATHLKYMKASIVLHDNTDNLSIPSSFSLLPIQQLFEEHSTEPCPSKCFLNKKHPATYLYTSGSTQSPKIVCHSLANHYYSALGSNGYLPINNYTLYHLSLPLYHIAGLAILFRTFLAGGAITISGESRSISHASMVPTQLYRLLKEPSTPISYQHILLGGSSIPPSLYYKARIRHIHIYPTYGMTEMSSQITTSHSQGAFSMGHPLPFRMIKISATGEICVKGKTLCLGYLQSDGSYRLPLDDEGYFHTSDLGSYSSSQGLIVHGRKDRMFISGGENIQPEDIETLLYAIDGISAAKVSPQPDKEFGYRPIAYITREANITDKFLYQHLAHYLPSFKIPIAFLKHPSYDTSNGSK